MKLKLCVLFAACIFAHPVKEEKYLEQLKNSKKYSPTVTDIKDLERDIWKATSNGDFYKALRLESRLEADILRAAFKALAQGKKDPIRSKRDLRELGFVVRRDKRTVNMLSSIAASGAQAGLSYLLGQKREDNGPFERNLIRIPRQGKPYRKTKISRRNDIELSNEILPHSSVLSLTTTDNPSVTTTEISTTTILNDAVKANANREEVTERVPARQEQEEEDEDEGNAGLGGLITSFLGSLSTPEGGVDLDAVTGLLGGISTQNEDGSYDFTGLQDTVGSLFGGGEEGGSNIGLFLGGLTGAIIRGSAGDDAAKGAGRIAGNLLAALLPGLSAYPTPEDGDDAKPQEGLDSGGFLSGLLSTLIGGLGGLSNSNSSGGDTGGGDQGGGGAGFIQLKFKLFRTIFSLITKVLGASSSSKQYHQQQKPPQQQ